MKKAEFIERLNGEDVEWFEDAGSFYFPDGAPRWLYELDVNVTGATFLDRPIYCGGKSIGYITMFGPIYV